MAKKGNKQENQHTPNDKIETTTPAQDTQGKSRQTPRGGRRP